MLMRSKVRGEGWSDKVEELINSVGGDQNNRGGVVVKLL